jgi:hypothetical protein
MKKLLISMTATLVCAGALAQGSLIFAINSDNLIYFTTDTAHLNPADVGKTFDLSPQGLGGPYPLAGSCASTDGTIPVLAGSPSFVAALYAGTSSTALSLQATAILDSWWSSNPGGTILVNANMAAPISAGTPAWFQVQVFDSRANAGAMVLNGFGGGASDAWAHLNWYAGESPIFRATPLAVPTDYIFNTSPPVNSTWAPGTFDPVDLAMICGAGCMYGGIALYVNPGPPPPQPGIISQPTNVTNLTGQGISFTVTVSGTPPFSYQWQFNGMDLSDGGNISGAATNTLTLGAISLADTGTYRLIITNTYGSVTSAPIVLTVLVAPIITVQPQSQTNLVGSNVTFTVSVTAYPPPTYRWAFNGSNISGATGASLLLTNIQVSQAGAYTVAVTNSAGYMISDPATLAVLSPPVLQSQPASQVGYWGMNASFGVEVAGTPPFTYQWYFYEFPISWGTNATLDLLDLDLDAAGQYWVEVSNSYGSVDSHTANLIVNPAGVFPGIYFGLTITGAVGKHFGIQYGTSIGGTTNWTALTNVTLTQPSQIWVDTSVNVSTTARRFYRVMAIP